MMRNKKSVVLALVGVVSTLACGDLGADASKPPLLVLDGQLRQSSALAEAAPAADHVRVAMIWNTSTVGYRSSHDIEVTPGFPSKFRLARAAPPPAEDDHLEIPAFLPRSS